jgi:hypothetical protein
MHTMVRYVSARVIAKSGSGRQDATNIEMVEVILM